MKNQEEVRQGGRGSRRKEFQAEGTRACERGLKVIEKRMVHPKPPRKAGGVGMGGTRWGKLVRAQAGKEAGARPLDSGYWRETLNFTCKH